MTWVRHLTSCPAQSGAGAVLPKVIPSHIGLEIRPFADKIPLFRNAGFFAIHAWLPQHPPSCVRVDFRVESPMIGYSRALLGVVQYALGTGDVHLGPRLSVGWYDRAPDSGRGLRVPIGGLLL
jgi:hypothetical protein